MEDLYLYTTIAIIPLVVLTLIAGFVVQFRFAKYSKETIFRGLRVRKPHEKFWTNTGFSTSQS